jgi:hypothetical protein
MAETKTVENPDRIIVRLDPGSPIELTGLTQSFAALARIYERHYRSDGGKAPKLFVAKLETGSIVAEIVPLSDLLGVTPAMDGSVIVADFTRRLWNGIKAFSEPSATHREQAPTREDASDIREFVRPLTGKRGAELGIKHARLERQEGERRTLVEYDFGEAELNRATVNIDHALASPDIPLTLT